MENHILEEPSVHPWANLFVPLERWAKSASIAIMILSLLGIGTVVFQFLNYNGNPLVIWTSSAINGIVLLCAWISYRKLYLSAFKLRSFAQTGDETELLGFTNHFIRHLVYYLVINIISLAFLIALLIQTISEY